MLFKSSLIVALLGVQVLAFEVDISRPQVAIGNGSSFTPGTSVLQCTGSSEHQYCCWSSPLLSDCECDDKNCPLDGVSVISDQKSCSANIDHKGFHGNAGDWTCRLASISFSGSRTVTAIANATTKLYVVDVNEVSHGSTCFQRSQQRCVEFYFFRHPPFAKSVKSNFPNPKINKPCHSNAIH